MRELMGQDDRYLLHCVFLDFFKEKENANLEIVLIMLTVSVHVGLQAFLQPTTRTPVSSRLVNHAVSGSCWKMRQNENLETITWNEINPPWPTDTRVLDVPPNRTLKEAGTSVAAVNPVMLPERFVPAYLARHWNRKGSTCQNHNLVILFNFKIPHANPKALSSYPFFPF